PWRSYHSSRPHSRYSTNFALLTWPLTSISVQRTTASRTTSAAPADSATCVVRISLPDMASTSFEVGGTPLEERADALLVVRAVIDAPPQRLDPLERLRVQRGRPGEDVQLLLQQPDHKRRIPGDLPGQLGGRALQPVGRDHLVDDPHMQRPGGGHRQGREQHLLDDRQADRPHE